MQFLSPALYSIFLTGLSKALNESRIKINVDGSLIINHLLYADDLVMLARSEDDLQALTDIVAELIRETMEIPDLRDQNQSI